MIEVIARSLFLLFHYYSALPRLGPALSAERGKEVQGSAKRHSTGLVNLVAALAYHFCLAFPAAFTNMGTTFKPSAVQRSGHFCKGQQGDG